MNFNPLMLLLLMPLLQQSDGGNGGKGMELDKLVTLIGAISGGDQSSLLDLLPKNDQTDKIMSLAKLLPNLTKQSELPPQPEPQASAMSEDELAKKKADEYLKEAERMYGKDKHSVNPENVAPYNPFKNLFGGKAPDEVTNTLYTLSRSGKI